MTGFLTRGQPAAVMRLESMLEAGVPHAILLSGPQSVGKTTLGLDLAAALLCVGDPALGRPCRACRSCRLVSSGNHADLHRLAPEGPGSEVRIGAVRQLIDELAYMPIEGGERVALIESAHRLNEDAQNALLKILEEPPAGVTIILAAEEEDRLLPTILSRVARVRLGTLSVRATEELLVELGQADAPTASRAARMAAGRPGIAIAYVRSPVAVGIRSEIALTLVDLLGAGRSTRLIRGRELLARAAELAVALDGGTSDPNGAGAAGAGPGGRSAASGRRRSERSGTAGAAVTVPTASPRPEGEAGGPVASADGAASAGEPADAGAGAESGAAAGLETGAAAGPQARTTPAERRRAAVMLLEVWRDLARDLALLSLGDATGLRQPELLEDLRVAVQRLGPGALGGFLRTLDRTAQLLDANANPELVTDALVLAWPRARRVA